jgi:site-specific recombinase XerD
MIRAAKQLAEYFERHYRLERDLAPSTVVHYRAAIKHFSEWLGRPPKFDDLTSERVNEWLFQRLDSGNRYTVRQPLHGQVATRCSAVRLAGRG